MSETTTILARLFISLIAIIVLTVYLFKYVPETKKGERKETSNFGLFSLVLFAVVYVLFIILSYIV